jgi:hypothetical protein
VVKRVGELRFGKVKVHEFQHAVSEVDGSAAIGDLDLAPKPMHVEGDEQVGGAVALILAAVARRAIADFW